MIEGLKKINLKKIIWTETGNVKIATLRVKKIILTIILREN